MEVTVKLTSDEKKVVGYCGEILYGILAYDILLVCRLFNDCIYWEELRTIFYKGQF
jgi:hypothetical protein